MPSASQGTLGTPRTVQRNLHGHQHHGHCFNAVELMVIAMRQNYTKAAGAQ